MALKKGDKLKVSIDSSTGRVRRDVVSSEVVIRGRPGVLNDSKSAAIDVHLYPVARFTLEGDVSLYPSAEHVGPDYEGPYLLMTSGVLRCGDLVFSADVGRADFPITREMWANYSHQLSEGVEGGELYIEGSGEISFKFKDRTGRWR